MSPIATHKQHIKQDERFGESVGPVHIEKNGLVLMHIGSDTGDAFVRGTCEYSFGKHRIRFIVTKKDALFHIFFDIISKSRWIPQNEDDMKRCTYGWRSNDETTPRENERSVREEFQDMIGQTKFEIELSLDCDKRKISYCNQQTRNVREMNVDIGKYPFPWQLLFCLFDAGDSVQFIFPS